MAKQVEELFEAPEAEEQPASGLRYKRSALLSGV